MALGYFGYPYTQVIFRALAEEGLGYRLFSIIIDYRLLSILPIDKNRLFFSVISIVIDYRY